MSFNSNIMLRKGVISLEPYVPGRSIEDVQKEFGLKNGIIKLASNENPLGPSPLAISDLSSTLSKIHRYPDSGVKSLRESLGIYDKVDSCSIFIGNGGDDVLSVLSRTILNEGDEVILPSPSFAPYEHVSRLMGAVPIFIGLDNFNIDLDTVLERVSKKTKLIFLCSPNNPTGKILSEEQLLNFLDSLPENVLVLLDEAYVDFVEEEKRVDTISMFENNPLFILRSFSKTFGLAGLRVGYGIGNDELVGYMNRVREPFNVNSVAQSASLFALNDAEFKDKVVRMVKEGRELLYSGFNRLGINFIESQANFIFVQVGDGDKVSNELMAQGVIVRPGSVFENKEWIRVTVGTLREIEIFLETLKKILKISC
ncbi:MAG: histidinol-phosphate transaminase [Nitrospinota bacterium]|nr:histidinol-phosphate transaminase [Nitrospinota bacterium]